MAHGRNFGSNREQLLRPGVGLVVAGSHDHTVTVGEIRRGRAGTLGVRHLHPKSTEAGQFALTRPRAPEGLRFLLAARVERAGHPSFPQSTG
jgi:hypothetical protein